MKDFLSNTKEYTVYPGEYIPLPEVEALREELKMPGKGMAAKPPVNMNELKDSFAIEVLVPGVKREDILVHVHDDILYIVVLHKESDVLKKKQKIHEFDTDCLERNIRLPKNADTEFVSAEYNNGMLCLHIPKTHAPLNRGTRQIVVY
jgi:HSP20 family protein